MYNCEPITIGHHEDIPEDEDKERRYNVKMLTESLEPVKDFVNKMSPAELDFNFLDFT